MSSSLPRILLPQPATLYRRGWYNLRNFSGAASKTAVPPSATEWRFLPPPCNRKKTMIHLHQQRRNNSSARGGPKFVFSLRQIMLMKGEFFRAVPRHRSEPFDLCRFDAAVKGISQLGVINTWMDMTISILFTERGPNVPTPTRAVDLNVVGRNSFVFVRLMVFGQHSSPHSSRRRLATTATGKRSR